MRVKTITMIRSIKHEGEWFEGIRVECSKCGETVFADTEDNLYNTPELDSSEVTKHEC